MKVFIIAIGHKMPSWVETAIHDYLKRMPKELPIIIKELKPEISPAKEAVKVQELVPKNSIVIALDERGTDLTTHQMSHHLSQFQQVGKDVYLLIGGADGLDEALKKSTQMMWRLSSLTLPHALARLLLVEQLYRSWTILQNHPYHRE
jgi:23S rRNA (pseudouridine1915-N3)-methyltransferase